MKTGTVVRGRRKGYLDLVLATALVHGYIGCSIDRYPVIPIHAGSGGWGAGNGGSPAGNGGSPAGNGGSPEGNGGSPAGSDGSPAGNGGTLAGNGSSGVSGDVDAATHTGGSRPPDPPTGSDAASADASTNDTAAGDDAEAPPGGDATVPPEFDSGGPRACDLRGIYGARITLEAYWGGRDIGGLVALVDPGRGTIVLHIIYHLSGIEIDGAIAGTAKTCGIELPPFYSTILCESYQPVYGLELWGRPSAPAFHFTGTAECTIPGCTVHINTVTALLGIELHDPAGPWPTPAETLTFECPSGQGADCFPDQDDDGFGGLTVSVLTEGAAPPAGVCPAYVFQGAPLGADIRAIMGLDIPRTDRIHIGTRAFVGGDVVIADDCLGGKGPAVAYGFESRAISCMNQEGMPAGTGTELAGPETMCQPEQRQFMDENLPLYNCMKEGDVPNPDLNLPDTSPSAGPQISIVRLGDFSDDVGCEDVRNAAY